jgi:rhodanese-related sulfurtransferase
LWRANCSKRSAKRGQVTDVEKPMNPPTIPEAGGPIDTATARRWLESGQASLVDVREPDEHARESIEGARLMPLSLFDPRAAAADGRRVILHCKSGRRSVEAAARMAAAGLPAFTLDGGIEAWRAAGGTTIVNRGVPIPIMRQVQLVVGSAILATCVLAWLVTPWFLLLTGFFGAGLVFAGATGFCGMAALLTAMPWNRALRGACGGCHPGRRD